MVGSAEPLMPLTGSGYPFAALLMPKRDALRLTGLIGGYLHNAHRKKPVTYLPLTRHSDEIRRRADELTREVIARVDAHIARHRADEQRRPRVSSTLRPRLF